MNQQHRRKKLRAHAVHLYTAAGVGLAFLAAAGIAAPAPDPRSVFLLLALAALVDGTDGYLARRWEVKRWAPGIDGRTIDDIVDYLTYTFVPLLLVWRMGWLPEPAALWIVPALVASLFGFANAGAKDERRGFFLGFPSYWNGVAFYAGILHHAAGPWPLAAIVVSLTVLTMLPVRFLYPSLAPRPWRAPLVAGAVAWLAIAVAMLPSYPNPTGWLVALSLIYPAAYIVLSFVLARRKLP